MINSEAKGCLHCKQLKLFAAYVHVRCGLSCTWKAVESPVLHLLNISVFMMDDLCCDFMLDTGVNPTLCTGVTFCDCFGGIHHYMCLFSFLNFLHLFPLWYIF